jgi:hypothetical protein
MIRSPLFCSTACRPGVLRLCCHARLPGAQKSHSADLPSPQGHAGGQLFPSDVTPVPPPAPVLPCVGAVQHRRSTRQWENSQTRVIHDFPLNSPRRRFGSTLHKSHNLKVSAPASFAVTHLRKSVTPAVTTMRKAIRTAAARIPRGTR